MNTARKLTTIVSSPLMLIAVPLAVLATQVTIPNTFAPNTVADANQVNANFTAIRNAFNALHTTGGVCLAAASVDGTTAAINRSFSNFTGAPAITAVKLAGLGNYEVDFGINVTARFWVATVGNPGAGSTTDTTIQVDARAGNVEAVFVQTRDTAGALADANFFIYIF